MEKVYDLISKHHTSKKKSNILLPFSFVFLFVLAACSDAVKEPFIPEQGIEKGILEGIELDLDNAFFDDFSSGVDYDKWIIGNGAWGANPNGGVIPENVSYTEDGILLLRGNGNYYSKDDLKGVGAIKDGRATGATLISRFLTGPGRYEIKMKPLPRKGACSTMWTYTNRVVPGEDNDNHEIDIELPGGKDHGNISFDYVLNTNYTTEKLAQSQDINVNDVTGGKVAHINDGNFHVFGFDWYTDPGYVIYSIDGIITAYSSSFIPSLQSRIWLGNWFPNNSGFVGNANFETDYMMVDYVKYIPFKDQTYTPWNPQVTVSGAYENQYPKSPISMPEVDILANGDFEFIKRREDTTIYGWDFSKLVGEKSEVSEVCYPSIGGGKFNSSCAVVSKGGYLTQVIDSVYPGQKLVLEFDALSDGSDSIVSLTSIDRLESAVEEISTSITSSSWKHYEVEVTVAEGCYSVMLEAYNTRLSKSTSTLKVDNMKVRRA